MPEDKSSTPGSGFFHWLFILLGIDDDLTGRAPSRFAILAFVLVLVLAFGLLLLIFLS